jgi:sugar/nucleoside kinase (ribokinase family)
MTKKYDVAGLGNPLIDILSSVSDEFFAAQNALTPMVHGKFNPADSATANAIYQNIAALQPPPVTMTGGSVANTIVGLASFGANVAFIGKTGADDFGTFFVKEMQTGNIATSMIIDQGNPTGSCIILVTGDGERTLNSYIGAADQITANEIDGHKDTIADSKVLVLEGYQFNTPQTKLALNHAADIAHQNGTAVAFTVSSERCIREHQADMMAMLSASKVDILFANEGETKALAGKADFNEAAKAISQLCPIVVTTCGPRGAIVSHQGQSIHVPAEKVAKVVDTTGAGDQFAAGFLFGYTHGYAMDKCARLGAMAAAEVIQVIGPRPPIPFTQLVQRLG